MMKISATLHNRSLAFGTFLIFDAGIFILKGEVHKLVQSTDFKRVSARKLNESGIFVIFKSEEDCEGFV